MDRIFSPYRFRKVPTPEEALREQIATDVRAIKALASQIPDYATFTRMLSDISDPTTRAQVQALLAPLVTFPMPEPDDDTTIEDEASSPLDHD